MKSILSIGEEQKPSETGRMKVSRIMTVDMSETKRIRTKLSASGAQNLDGFDARTYDATAGLSDDQRTSVIEDLNTYDNLQSIRRTISREMDRAYARSHHRSRCGNLEFEHCWCYS